MDRLKQAVSSLVRAGEEARKYGVGLQIAVSSEDFSRPLKTVAGAVAKVKRYARCGVWEGWWTVSYVAKTGKRYRTAEAAKRYGELASWKEAGKMASEDEKGGE